MDMIVGMKMDPIGSQGVAVLGGVALLDYVWPC